MITNLYGTKFVYDISEVITNRYTRESNMC